MSRLTDLIAMAKAKEPQLGADLEREFRALSSRLSFGLNFERHKPEAVELPQRPVRRGDKVRVLPARASTTGGDQRLWLVKTTFKAGDEKRAELELLDASAQRSTAQLSDLIVVAEFRDTIYPGLVSTGRVSRFGDKPWHTVINGENYHVLKALTWTHRGKVDAIYIDPPYNTRDRDWKYNNDYVNSDDLYRHSKWLAMMERRLVVAEELLKPANSVLIVTIDEKEYLRLGLLLEQLFPEARIQMISSVINPKGAARGSAFGRTDEYIFFVMFGAAAPLPTALDTEWKIVKDRRAERLRWADLLRSGSHPLRSDSPNQFYPVFIQNSVDGPKFHSVGKPYFGDDRGEIIPPAGTVAVWPIRTFTLFDKAYQGGIVTLNATTPDGEKKTATAFESNPQDLKSPGLGKYRNIATANITFAAKAPDAPPAAIAIQVYKTVNGALQKAAVVVAGTPVAFGFSAKNATVTAATVQGTALSVRADSTKATSEPQVADGFTPSTPGSYTVTATAAPAFGPPITASSTFRVIASAGGGSGGDPGTGSGALTNLPNDPPAVVTGLTVPRANATGVQTSVFPQVTFTEPVKHVPQHVVLQGGGSYVPILLSGDGPNGTVDPLTTDDQVVTSLTIQPLQPLLYNTTYTLTLTADIVDLDVGLDGQPAPKALVLYTATFTTFAPEQIGQSTESYSSPAIVVLGDRGYLAVPLPNQAGLKIYDVSDPTALAEVLPSEPIVTVGYPYDLVGEETSPLTGGRVVALTTGPIGVPYRPSDVYLYDVSTDQPQWIGAVTLGNSPSDGVARRTVMKDGVLYAATAGLGKGIQIVDLNLAISNFQTATANGTSSLEYYQMLAQLGLEGQGFGQDAISNTIFVDTGSDQNSRLWDLAVGDLNVDGNSTRIVAATGARALVLANPVTGEILYNGPVTTAVGTPAIAWGYSIGLTKIGTQDIAALIGFASGAGSPVLVTVDITDPRHPYAVGLLRLNNDQFDQRSRIIIHNNIALIPGLTTAAIDLSDASRPRVQGTIAGLSGNLALAGDHLLFSIRTPLVAGRGGVRSALLDDTRLAIIRPTSKSADPRGLQEQFAALVATADVQMAPADDEFRWLEPGGTVYGGSTSALSDRLKLHVNAVSPVAVKSYEWRVTGAGASQYLPSTSSDWEVAIKPVPGTLSFAVTVTFADGETRRAALDVDVGVRTNDVVVIGWIDPNGVPLSSANVSPELLELIPPVEPSSLSLDGKLAAAVYLFRVASGSTDLPGHPRDGIVPMTDVDKTYLLNWLFKAAANQCPADCPPTYFSSDADLSAFAANETGYKLFNRFQVKYRVKNGEIADHPDVLQRQTEVGSTKNPLFPSIHEKGAYGPENGKVVSSAQSISLINDGTPVSIAVDMFNTLAAPLRWNNIGSRIDFGVLLGADKMVSTQVYPTYFIFDNRLTMTTVPQAQTPLGNFNLNPYPPGPAPFIIKP